MELSVLNKWVFNFCIGNIPLGERVLEKLEKDIYNEKQAKRLYTQPQWKYMESEKQIKLCTCHRNKMNEVEMHKNFENR